jgi:signal transduction histidine kinase/ligand-binding sensor domain-containing protein
MFVLPSAKSLSVLRFRAGLALMLICWAAPFCGRAAWFMRTWQTDDGLPDNEVTAIAQGRDGYLWVGTFVGLARFDGIHFTRFPYMLSSSNGDEGVTELLPARDGGLWIRTHQGPVFGLGPDFLSVTAPTNDLQSLRAVAAIDDNSGCLWIATPDAIWQLRNGQASRLTGYQGMMSQGSPSAFAIDNDGQVWFAKGNGVFIYRQGRFEPVTRTPYKAHLAASRSGGMWIADGKQLLKCDSAGYVQEHGSFSTVDIHAGTTVIMEDHTGAVWIGTGNGGLFRYTESSGFEKVETSHPEILSLCEDREGNIWVGTAGGGLDRINTRGVYLEGVETNSSLVTIQSICEDTNGVMWGVDQNSSLVSRINGHWRPALPAAPWTNAVECVAADQNGAIWVGTRNGGLYCWHNGRFGHWGAEEGLTIHVITDLLPDVAGDLWVVGEDPDGLQCLHDGQLRFVRTPRSWQRMTAAAEDASGNIWASFQAGVLMRVEGDKLKAQTTAQSPDPILYLYPTTDGALWIGYEGGGLGRLKDGIFSRINSEQGLSDDYISQIADDGDGWLWFGGERGIFKVRRTELEMAMDGKIAHVHCINYGKNEGLFSAAADSSDANTFVLPHAMRSRDGRLWIPLRKALAVIDPNILRVAQIPPPVLLSQVTMDGQTIASYGGAAATPETANLTAPDISLQLPPDYRHLEFNFTAINLSAPEDIRFRYRLVGFDNDWIQAEEERSASYSRLLAGNYQFRVEARLGDGPWNETPTTLSLTVAPFFWQTWWFRTAIILFFTSSVIAVVRYSLFRHMQAEMRRLEQRAQLDKERTRIARDLHDDLGCSLNKVALTLDMTQRQIESSQMVNGKIQNCSDMVRQVAKSVDEIVWAINPRNDSLHYLVDYVSQFTVEFLHAADIPCRVDLPDDIPNCVISPEARHNLFLVVKEALNNIVRHAGAGEVQLHITTAEEQITIAIKDNGRGFERPPENATCDGLRNMRQRMDEIGGRFELKTSPGAGTEVAFFYSWPQKNGGPKHAISAGQTPA